MAVREVAYRLKVDGKSETRRAFQEVAQDGKAGADAIAASYGKVGSAIDAASTKAVAASDRQMAAWKVQAAKAREIEAAMERQARFNAVLGVGSGGGKSAEASAMAFMTGGSGLSKNQMASRLNLSRQFADVGVTAAMGMNPAMIAIQQGPQIFDAWATSGIKLKASLVATTAGVAGLATVLGVAAAAGLKYDAAMRSADVASRGLGSTAGVTGAQLEAMAARGAAASDTAISSAREMAAAYVSTGRIGAPVLESLIGLTRNYAATTRQDAAAATKELAAAFADPAKGAADLNAKLNILMPAELQHIQNLAKAGDAAGAQRALVDALRGSLIDANTATGFWATGMNNLKVAADNALAAVGKVVAAATGTGDDIQKLNELRRQRMLLVNSPLAFLRQGELKTIDSEIEQLRVKAVAGWEAMRNASGRVQAANDNAGLIDAANPTAVRLRDLRSQRDRLQALINNPAALADTGRSAADARKGLADLNEQIGALEAGYRSVSAQTAAWNRANRAAVKDAKEEAREAEEAERKRQGLYDVRLGMTLKLRSIEGEGVDIIEREIAFRNIVSQLTSQGVTAEKARAEASRQVRLEAEAEARVRNRTPDGFRANGEIMKALAARSGNLTTDPLRPYLDSAGDHFADALRSGMMAAANNDSFFDTFRDNLKNSIVSAFADRATSAAMNLLFGQKGGAGGNGLIGLGLAALKGAGRNAEGTDNWRGGLSWVGEKGPELLNIPRGAQIISNANSKAMMGGGGTVVINNNIDARGAGPNEVQALRGELDSLKRDLPARIVAATNDGIARGAISTLRG